MEKYLKMSDFIVGDVYMSMNHNGDVSVQYDYADPDMIVRKTMDAMGHAINSHDELVAMNKEILAALELMLLIHDEPSGFCGKFGKELDMAIEDQKEKIDTRIAVARNAIAKAKVA